MNKLYYLVSLLIISIMLSGCRSEVLVKPIPALKKLKTITSGKTTTTGDEIDFVTTFDYNSDRKLSRVTENNIYLNSGPSYIDTTNFTYLRVNSRDNINAQIIIHYYPKCYRYIYAQVNALNSFGYVSTSIQNNTPLTKYEYDGKGFCTKSTVCGDGNISRDIVTTFKYLGDNMDSVFIYHDNDNYILTYTYTYYLDKLNTISPVKNEWFGYFGRESKNLVKNVLLFDRQINHVFTTNYVYEFDANNYVTKRIMTDDSGYVTWDKYAYQ